MSMFKGLVTKEFREAFRDKRALMAAGFGIVMGPIIVAAVMMFQIDEATSVKNSYVKFVGAEHAPQLISALNARKILSIDEVSDEEAQKWTKRDITLTIPDNFSENMAQAKPVTVVLNADYSQKNIGTVLRRIERTVESYSGQVGSMRLLMRGIDPRVAQPITLQVQNTATPEAKSGIIMGMVAMFIMTSLFTASMTASIDTSAGERERHSLELILCQPISTVKVVLSKVVCVSTYGAIASILTMLAMTFTMTMLPLEKIGISITVDPLTMIIIAIMVLPLAYLAGIAQLFFAYQAKTFKEAQSYLSMILILPMLVPMAIMIMPHKPEWLNNLPLAGHSIIMEELFKGKALDVVAFAATNAFTIAIAVVMTVLLARSLRSEKVVLALS